MSNLLRALRESQDRLESRARDVWSANIFSNPPIFKKISKKGKLSPAAYHTKPNLTPIGVSLFGEFLGVELELECGDGFEEAREEIVYESNIAINSFEPDSPFCIFKHDSSLKNGGAAGFEMCSRPASLEEHKKRWASFYNNIPEGVSISSRCGMHVHVSKNPLTTLQIGKIIEFIHNPKNVLFLTKIAGRASNDYSNYSDKKTAKFALHKYINSFSHRSALNPLNGSTIEFRLFASPINFNSFAKNIEFCHALVKYTAAGNYSIRESLSHANFVKFIDENRRFYPYLASFLNGLGYKVRNISTETITLESR
jgi:hypothetical protein